MHIIKDIKRPSKELVSEFVKLPSATVIEAAGKKGAMAYQIKPLDREMKLCGSALTVASHVGDNITLHKAITVAQPGDVLVADVGDYREAGGWGEITTTAARMRGIVGLVINGCVRDAARIRELKFPVFCLGLSIKATVKETLGYINYPICCGGVQVKAGDIVLGDEDGVVVISLEEAEEVLKKSQERERKESAIIEEIRRGKTTMDLLGFDKVLEKEGLRRQ